MITSDQVNTLRRVYSDSGIGDECLSASPIKLFTKWFDDAKASDQVEPNAMCLSTSTTNGRPSSRFVLMKSFDERGLVFVSNYKSKKGLELEGNPFACVSFWWPKLEKQVRIEGVVEKTSPEESDDLFNKRPLDARLSVFASSQSSPICSRTALEEKKLIVEQKFSGDEEVPRPEYWGGYRLIPEYMEFWKGRKSRLHDRIAFVLENDNWTSCRLQP